MAEEYKFTHWCFKRDNATTLILCQERQEDHFDDCITCSGPEPKTAEEITDLQERVSSPTQQPKQKNTFHYPPPKSERPDHPCTTTPKITECSGCGKPLKGFGKTGLCRACSCRINAKKAKTPQAKANQAESNRNNRALKKAQLSPPPSAPQPTTPKQNNTRESLRVSVDFANNEDLLNKLKAHADKMFRSQNGQILFIITDYLQKINPQN